MVSVGRRWVWATVGVLALLVMAPILLSGCRSNEAASLTPTPTKTPRPTFTSPAMQPIQESTPTGTFTPTAEPTKEPTATETPTSTPTSQPTETPTPSVTPFPTLDPNACPLTGLPVSDLSLLERRPLAIKVQNAPLSRPQYGLPQADIVFEHLSEAGITSHPLVEVLALLAKGLEPITVPKQVF